MMVADNREAVLRSILIGIESSITFDSAHGAALDANGGPVLEFDAHILDCAQLTGDAQRLTKVFVIVLLRHLGQELAEETRGDAILAGEAAAIYNINTVSIEPKIFEIIIDHLASAGVAAHTVLPIA